MKARKKKQKKNKPPLESIGKLKTTAVVGVVAVLIVLVIGATFAVAKDGLLEASGTKESAGRFKQQMRGSAEPTSIAHAASSQMSEAMPEKAKVAKTRQEAKQIIAQVQDSNSAITYDPWGRLAKIVEPDSTVRQFIYSGDRLCEERDGNGAVTKQFFTWGEMIGSTKYFYTRDHLGSVTEMTDESGNVIAQYRYDPWGNVTRIAGSGPDSDFLYAGYFYHKPSGLYITRHRLYSPKLGRWLNRDPIDDTTFAIMPPNPELQSAPENEAATGAPINANFMTAYDASKNLKTQTQLALAGAPQANPYTYVHNTPVNLSDPSGLREHYDEQVPCPYCCKKQGMPPVPYWCTHRKSKEWDPRTKQWYWAESTFFQDTSARPGAPNVWTATPQVGGGCYWSGPT